MSATAPDSQSPLSLTEQIVAHEQFFAQSFACVSDMVVWIGADGHLLHANPSALRRYGLSLEQLRALTIHDLDSDFKPELWPQHWDALKRAGTLRVRVQHRDASGQYFPVEIFDTYTQLGEFEFSVTIMRDMSQRDEHQHRMEMMQFSVDQMTDTVLWIDREARIMFANDAACRNLGYAHDELTQMTIADIDPNYPSKRWPQHWEDLREHRSLTFESSHRAKDGHIIPIEVTANFLQSQDREVNVAFIRDITERKLQEQRLRHVATHDGLTGLPNRDLLNDRVEQAVARARRHDGHLALFMVDLDKFKIVNDTFGHDAGDRLLTATSLRMRSALRATDTVARQGGDEFVVLVDEIHHPRDAQNVAEKLLAAITEPVDIGVEVVEPGASIGIAVYPHHGEDSRSLFKNADVAMYQAKANGRGHYQFYRDEFSAKLNEQFQMITGLQRALDEDEFVLHYQPVYDLSSNTLVGAEALLRWRHPDGHLVPPLNFIPVAEESGLIVPIGSWVINEVCRQSRAWSDQGLATVPVAVNLSARQLRTEGIISVVEDALQAYNLDASRLSVELTESMVMENPERVINILEAFKAMGICIAIDDFGTGYSSLSYLQRFPVDVIKIDRSFVKDIGVDENDAIIANAVIQLGHSMGYQVLAEGIENDFQQTHLSTQQCDLVQGYHLGKPVPAVEFAALLPRA